MHIQSYTILHRQMLLHCIVYYIIKCFYIFVSDGKRHCVISTPLQT